MQEKVGEGEGSRSRKMRTFAIRKLRAYVKHSWHEREKEHEEEEEESIHNRERRIRLGVHRPFYRSATEKSKYAERDLMNSLNERTDAVEAAAGKELSVGETEGLFFLAELTLHWIFVPFLFNAKLYICFSP